MDKIFTKRLSILADALEQDKHGHEVWDYRRVMSRSGCGTAGCAMGSLPYVFPTHWEVKYDTPVMRDGAHFSTIAVCNFLGITEKERSELFTINAYLPVHGESVTPQMVAAKIRTLLEVKGKEPQ